MTSMKHPVYFLLVDDLEENLLSLEALLRRPGLTMLKARSGPEALELLLKYDIALALLDVQMPGMDGFELAELMRGNERTRRVPIIFLTAGLADSQRRFHGYEKGAVDFLHKPIEPDILKSKTDVFFELHLQKQVLAQQRDELRSTYEALQETDRRKDEFLATLAHELRNPLAPVRNGLRLLNMNEQNTEAKNLLEMMDRQVTHLVRLIDDLLDVSRVSNGKIDLRKEPVTARDIITLAVETSQPMIDDGQHSLTVKMPEEDVWLNGDPNRLSQVIANLLTNAAKYTRTKGKIFLSVRIDKEEVVISVTDNGIGIASHMLTQVFELFAQVGNEMAKSQSGLGIGLALVKKLVEMHDGSIIAQSDGLELGSTFIVRLPLLRDHATSSAAAHEVDATASPARPLSILVVDDNIPSAQTTGWMLEMIGHHPTLAHDGIEALETAKKILPQAILLDIGLPGMNGYDICRTLRQNPLFKETLIIAQTGWGQARDKQMAIEAGFDHHLVKPFNFDQLSELLSAKAS